jgi:murein DD-endopeptidase MepM/ murein hydrolase activator NlpD
MQDRYIVFASGNLSSIAAPQRSSDEPLLLSERADARTADPPSLVVPARLPPPRQPRRRWLPFGRTRQAAPRTTPGAALADDGPTKPERREPSLLPGGTRAQKIEKILSWTVLAGSLALAGTYLRFEHPQWLGASLAPAAIRLAPAERVVEFALPASRRASDPAVSTTAAPFGREAVLALAALEHRAQPAAFQRLLRVERGDNLFVLLMKAGVPGAEAQLASLSLTGVYDLRRLRQGQLLAIDFGVREDAHNSFLGLRFDSSFDRTVSVRRREGGEFAASETKKDLTLELLRGDAEIDHSVFQAGLQAGLPPEPLVRMIHLFSYEVDFQRDVQKGDRFEVLIEVHRDPSGTIVRYGDIRYAALWLQEGPIRLYQWEGEGGEPEYFTRQGESTKKELMRTPVDGARLSSGFGFRRHPILGYSKLHRGVDFAAPAGTPIYAAGNGTLDKAGWLGGYGKAIVIRHNREVSTLYAHMTGFAAGMGAGRRVRQGEIIGYVGSTGMSTGPHLHYEVHQNGTPINPLGLKLPSRQRLAGAELERFQLQVRISDIAFAGLARNGRTSPLLTTAAERDIIPTGAHP